MQPQRPAQETTRTQRRRAPLAILAVSVLGLALAGSVAGMLGRGGERAPPRRPLPPEPKPELLPPPPIDEEYFPCSDCHEGEPADPQVRKLDEHADIVLKHGDLWCLDCHQSDQRDLLHLSDASPVEMEESWRLCTRCHARKIPDWRAGVHGKRTGYWRGPKQVRTCVHCHDPHSPHFKPLEPEPPPIPAARIRASVRLEEVPDAGH